MSEYVKCPHCGTELLISVVSVGAGGGGAGSEPIAIGGGGYRPNPNVVAPPDVQENRGIEGAGRNRLHTPNTNVIAPIFEKREIYTGPIEVGMKFIWMKHRPSAYAHVEVIRIDTGDDERRIWTRTLAGGYINAVGREVWNDESRFREAVTPA